MTLVATERGERLELHVRDDGPGFDPDFVPRAFQRFSRADEARGSEGTGLGLAVVEGIAVAHGGHAEAANRTSAGADAGSRFRWPAGGRRADAVVSRATPTGQSRRDAGKKRTRSIRLPADCSRTSPTPGQ